MQFTKITVAAFVALCTTVNAAPTHYGSFQYGSNNDNNGAVIGSGNGGDGGYNYATPVVISGAKSKGSWGSTSSSGKNTVDQSADGGSGFAVGSFGSHNHISRGNVNVDPSVAILSDNDNNGFVIGSGNGGMGGTNVAIPIVKSGASSKHSKGSTSSKGSNAVWQSANGGDGSAVGTYGSHNNFGRDFDERDIELDERDEIDERNWKSIFSNNDNNGIVYGSGNGGDGGYNYAKPIVVSGASSKHSKGSTSSSGSNDVWQSANGGDGSAVGTYVSHNNFGRDFEERGGHGSFSYGSNNDNNGIVYGSGNGGDGGYNFAEPIVITGAKSKHSGGKTTSSGSNSVWQSANGGDGSAVGTYGSGNTFHSRGGSFQYLSGNDNNGIVVGSGNGGDGGYNIAEPIVFTGAKSKHSKGSTSSSGWNSVQQSANGGSGSAVGTYGSHNTFGRRGGSVSVLSGNDNNGAAIFSGNGGNGGENVAVPIVFSGAKSKGSWGSTSSKGSNWVGQSADGGSGSAVGSFGSHNHA